MNVAECMCVEGWYTLVVSMNMYLNMVVSIQQNDITLIFSSTHLFLVQ